MSASPFIRRVLLYSIVHYAVLLLLGGLIFLTSHLPPKVINLDPVTSALVFLEDILVFPRRVLFRLWPAETTPLWLGWTLTLANSLVWGTMLAFARKQLAFSKP